MQVDEGTSRALRTLVEACDESVENHNSRRRAEEGSITMTPFQTAVGEPAATTTVRQRSDPDAHAGRRGRKGALAGLPDENEPIVPPRESPQGIAAWPLRVNSEPQQ